MTVDMKRMSIDLKRQNATVLIDQDSDTQLLAAKAITRELF